MPDHKWPLRWRFGTNRYALGMLQSTMARQADGTPLMRISNRRLAREWLWFAGTVAAVFVLGIWAAAYRDTSAVLDDFWQAVLWVYGLISFVRLTVWALRNRRAPN